MVLDYNGTRIGGDQDLDPGAPNQKNITFRNQTKILPKQQQKTNTDQNQMAGVFARFNSWFRLKLFHIQVVKTYTGGPGIKNDNLFTPVGESS